MEKLLDCCHEPPTIEEIYDCCKQEKLNIGAKLSRRQYLRQHHEVPTFDEMNASVGSCLGDIIRHGLNPVMRKSTFVDDPLKGPQKPLWISPKTDENVLTNPPTQDTTKALQHNFILEVGQKVEEKYENAIKARMIEDFIMKERDFHLFECRKKREFLKEKERLRCEETCIQLENTLTEQFELEKIELYKSFDKCRLILTDFLIKKCDMEAQEMVKNAVQITKAYMNVLFLEQLQRDTEKIEMKTKESMERMLKLKEAECNAKINQMMLQNSESLAKQKHFLHCKNLTELMHTICAEKANARLKMSHMQTECDRDKEQFRGEVEDKCRAAMEINEVEDAQLKNEWKNILTEALAQKGNACYCYDKAYKKIDKIFKYIMNSTTKSDVTEVCSADIPRGDDCSKIFIIGGDCLADKALIDECAKEIEDFDALDKRTYEERKSKRSSGTSSFDPNDSKIKIQWEKKINDIPEGSELEYDMSSELSSDSIIISNDAMDTESPPVRQINKLQSDDEMLETIQQFISQPNAASLILHKILRPNSTIATEGERIHSFLAKEITKIIDDEVLHFTPPPSDILRKSMFRSKSKISPRMSRKYPLITTVDSLELVGLTTYKEPKPMDIPKLLTTQDSLEIVRHKLSNDSTTRECFCSASKLDAEEKLAKDGQCRWSTLCDIAVRDTTLDLRESVEKESVESDESSMEILGVGSARRSIIKQDSTSMEKKFRIPSENKLIEDVFKSNKMRDLLSMMMENEKIKDIIMEKK